MKPIALVVSCEHAVDTVPEPYRALFAPFQELLATHRGIDFGALTIAKNIKQHIRCDFIQATTTRLLIDCNKSIKHPRCFSEVTQTLPLLEKRKIAETYYWPYRKQLMSIIQERIDQGKQVWHLSIHSFTPILHHTIRNADIGLLYDPKRRAEKRLALEWKKEIKNLHPKYRIRMNYPYTGISDGFTSNTRKKYPETDYIGIEVETNQALTQQEPTLNIVKNILTTSLGLVFNSLA